MSNVFSALVCGFTSGGKLITDPDECQEKVWVCGCMCGGVFLICDIDIFFYSYVFPYYHLLLKALQ